MTDGDIDARYATGESLVREAGALALRMRENPATLEITAKGPMDFATAADRRVEELIGQRLRNTFGDAVLGEEFGGCGVDRLWVVDPIDGTYNYIRGSSQWCVSLAYLVDGEPEIGFIFKPVYGEMCTARRGHGAALNSGKIAVSGSRFASQPLIEVGASNRRPLGEYLAILERLMANGIDTRHYGSGALGLVRVAMGVTDGYCEQHINAWDVAAGIVAVREAGGWTNDFFFKGGLARGNPILACTPEMQARLSELTGIA
jgi:myo-inositol-1(or 4)-monophosphatase